MSEQVLIVLLALAIAVLCWVVLVRIQGVVSHGTEQKKEIEELQRKIDSVVQSRAPTDAPELERCPNCAGAAIYVAGPGYNLVRCRVCGLETHEAHTNLFDDPQKTVGQIWNNGDPDSLDWENVKEEKNGSTETSQ